MADYNFFVVGNDESEVEGYYVAPSIIEVGVSHDEEGRPLMFSKAVSGRKDILVYDFIAAVLGCEQVREALD